MKWILLIAGIIAGLILVITLIGYCLPVKHTAALKRVINAAPDRVWERLVSFGKYPEWRKDVKQVEVLSVTDWIETDKYNGKIPFTIIQSEPGRILVTRINATNKPFGGSWHFLLEGNGNTTTVTITENGEVYNPLFRFVSRFIMGHTATIKAYQDQLEASFR